MSRGEIIPTSSRIWVVRGIRLLGVVVVCILLTWQWDRVLVAGRILVDGSPVAWGVAAVLQFCCLLVAAFRLSLLVRAVGHKIPLPTLFFDLVCTTALNAALLLGVGDLYRIRRTNQWIENLALSSSIIILDRMLGFAVLCAVATVSLAMIGAPGFAFQGRYLLIGGVVAIAVVIVMRVMARRSKVSVWRNLQRPFIAMVSRPVIGLGALFSSLLLTTLWLTSIIVVARGLGIETPVLPIVFAAAAVTVATILPISVGGIGIRETGYAFLLAGYGTSTSQAIALGIAQYALFLPVIAAGAAVGVFRHYRSLSQPE